MRVSVHQRFFSVFSPFIFCLLSFTLWSASVRAMPVFINELHYDNVGADVGEAVELAGLAGTDLVDAANQLQQFISYEGAFTASNGVAINRLSKDMGIAERSAAAIGRLLQLTGNELAGFQWRAGVNSFGAINAFQQFVVQEVERGSVASVSTSLLLTLGLMGLAVRVSN